MNRRPVIALLWHRAEDETKARRARLDSVFRALAAVGAAPEPIIYADWLVEAAREQLLRVDGVLVWVNPITEGRDRAVLDALLKEVADAGVWVSAHPDVVSMLGTKEILYRTRTLGWGSDVRLYDDVAALQEALPSRLSGGPCVLKRARGNGGLGVWKLELATPGAPPRLASVVRVEHAYDGATTALGLDAFVASFADYLGGGGRLVEQPFLPRVREGMVRCYISGRSVAGFGEHVPRGFAAVPSPRDASAEGSTSLGYEKVMHGREVSRFRSLRDALETDWIPAMLSLIGLDEGSLPAIWDADFIRGARAADGKDSWVLCEINASCVSPFPDGAAEPIARWTCACVEAPGPGSPP